MFACLGGGQNAARRLYFCCDIYICCTKCLARKGAIFSREGTRAEKSWDEKAEPEKIILNSPMNEEDAISYSLDGSHILTIGVNTAKVWDARPYSESFAEREAAEAKR